MFVNAGSAAAANLISTEYMHMSSVAPYYPTLIKKQTNRVKEIERGGVIYVSPANLFSCEVTFKSYLRNLTWQIRNAISCDWTKKNSAPCPADVRHKDSESIAQPFIYYSMVTMYEHNLESKDNS
jgi:hypothetical protein